MKTWDVACRVILGALAVIVVAFTAQRGLAGPEGSKGARCFDDGSCLMLTEEHCLAEGGEWAGAGTTCEDVDCSGQHEGACCLPNGACHVLTEDHCIADGGEWAGAGTICEDVDCGAGGDGDANGDGAVNIIDLFLVLASWGDCPEPPEQCEADFNHDNMVNVLDLLILLATWG